MTKYYWENDKLRSTNRKVTKNFIYSKNSVCRNNLGTIYASKKSAIRGRIKQLHDQNKQLDLEITDKEIKINSNLRIISKLKKDVNI